MSTDFYRKISIIICVGVAALLLLEVAFACYDAINKITALGSIQRF